MEPMDEDSNGKYGPSPNKRLKVEESSEAQNPYDKPCSSSTDSADSQYSMGEKELDGEPKPLSPKLKEQNDEPSVEECSSSAVQGSQCSNVSSSSELKDLQLELKKAFEQYNPDVETKINVAEVTVESCDNSPDLTDMDESPSSKIIEILTQDGDKVCSVEVGEKGEENIPQSER